MTKRRVAFPLAFLLASACGTEAAPSFSGPGATEAEAPPAPAVDPATVSSSPAVAPAVAAPVVPLPPVAPPVPPPSVPLPPGAPPPLPSGVAPELAEVLLAEAHAERDVEGIMGLVPIALGPGQRIVAATLGAESMACPGPDPTRILVAVAEPAAGAPEVRSSYELPLLGEDLSGVHNPCDVVTALELRDFDGDGSDELSLIRMTSGSGDYPWVTESTLIVLEVAPSVERLFEVELAIAAVGGTGGPCYGDAQPTRNERATVVWSPGLGPALDLTIIREDSAPECVHEMRPVHRRGPTGSCIQEQTYGFSERLRTWFPYRGIAATGFILIGATGDAAELETRRAEIAAAYDGFEPGYPIVVRTDDIAGLRPGLDILVLASCISREGASDVKRALPAPLGRHAEVRGVAATTLPLGCPRAVTPRAL